MADWGSMDRVMTQTLYQIFQIFDRALNVLFKLKSSVECFRSTGKFFKNSVECFKNSAERFEGLAGSSETDARSNLLISRHIKNL